MAYEMSNLEFTWCPDEQWSFKKKPSVSSAKFGDGYEQRTSTGLNNTSKEFRLKFTRGMVEANSIDRFLTIMGGKNCFEWRSPLGIKNTYICKEWETSRVDAAFLSVSATFGQVFEVPYSGVSFDTVGYLERKKSGGDYSNHESRFKLPNHIVFSLDSEFSSTTGVLGGKWATEGSNSIFYPSAYNLSLYSVEDYRSYFPTNERSNVGVFVDGIKTMGTLA